MDFIIFSQDFNHCLYSHNQQCASHTQTRAGSGATMSRSCAADRGYFLRLLKGAGKKPRRASMLGIQDGLLERKINAAETDGLDCEQSLISVVSFAAVFWMSRNAPYSFGVRQKSGKITSTRARLEVPRSTNSRHVSHEPCACTHSCRNLRLLANYTDGRVACCVLKSYGSSNFPRKIQIIVKVIWL